MNSAEVNSYGSFNIIIVSHSCKICLIIEERAFCRYPILFKVNTRLQNVKYFLCDKILSVKMKYYWTLRDNKNYNHSGIIYYKLVFFSTLHFIYSHKIKTFQRREMAHLRAISLCSCNNLHRGHKIVVI